MTGQLFDEQPARSEVPTHRGSGVRAPEANTEDGFREGVPGKASCLPPRRSTCGICGAEHEPVTSGRSAAEMYANIRRRGEAGRRAYLARLEELGP